MSQYNHAVECLEKVIEVWLLKDSLEYFPVVCGSARGKKYELVHQSIRLALKARHFSHHRQQTFPKKSWVNDANVETDRDEGLVVLDIPFSSQSYESLDFVYHQNTHLSSTSSSIFRRIVDTLLNYCQRHRGMAEARQKEIRKHVRDILTPIQTHLANTRTSTVSSHLQQQSSRIQDISPWLINNIQNIEIESYEKQAEIPSSATTKTARVVSSTGIKLRYQTPDLQATPCQQPALPDSFIKTAGQSLAHLINDMIQDHEPVVLLMMDMMQWFDGFALRDVKTIQREKLNTDDHWLDFEWVIFREFALELLSMSKQKTRRVFFIFTTIPTPKDVLDPNFYFESKDNNHPFIEAFLTKGRREKKWQTEPIDADLYFWRPFTTDHPSRSWMHMSDLFPIRMNRFDYEREAQDELLDKLESKKVAIPQEHANKLDKLYKDTLPILIDALEKQKYSQVVHLIKSLRSSHVFVKYLIAYPHFTFMFQMLKQRFVDCPLDSDISMEFSPNATTDSSARLLVYSRHACSTLATLLAHLSEHLQPDYTLQPLFIQLSSKCIHMILNGNTQEMISGGLLLSNMCSNYPRSNFRHDIQLIRTASEKLVMRADYLKSFDDMIEQRISLYSIGIDLFDVVYQSCYDVSVRNTAGMFAECLHNALSLLLRKINMESKMENVKVEVLDSILTKMVNVSCVILLASSCGHPDDTLQRGILRSLTELSRMQSFAPEYTFECANRAVYWLRRVHCHAIVDKNPRIATVQQLWATTHPQDRECSVHWEQFLAPY